MGQTVIAFALASKSDLQCQKCFHLPNGSYMTIDRSVYNEVTPLISRVGAADAAMDSFNSNFHRYRRKIVFFLGAGASIGARNKDGELLPSASGLRDRIYTELILGEGYDRENPPDLGTLTLDHVAAIAENKVGRRELLDLVDRQFDCDQAMWAHKALPFFEPLAIYTTNYDQLIENAFSAVGRNRDLVPVFSDPNQRLNDNRIALYKPHGSADRLRQPVGQGGLVVTQFDYFEIISSKKNLIEDYLNFIQSKDCCVIFVGYSFQDMDITSKIYRMRQENSDVIWYAVFPRNDADVKAMYLERFKIKQISRTFAEFVYEVNKEHGILPETLDGVGRPNP